VDGNFDDCLELARKTAAQYPIELVNSVNVVRLEGQKTASFEICDVLGHAPDVHILPVGNAGNITAYWQGYREYADDGVIENTPRMFGFQAEGAAPIVRGEPVLRPETVATAIRVGNPASWAGAVAARDESNGLIDQVTDEQILNAYRLLPSAEGVFVEPGSAASVAGLLRTAEDGRLPKSSLVVCTVTGHGLKDPDTALANAIDIKPLPVDPGAVASALDLS
jgi:threonine synthase